LKESRILAVQDENGRLAEPVMGIPLEFIPFAEVNAAWQAADKEEANAVAEKWVKNASNVVNVPFTEIQNSAAMYLGMKSVLKKHQANAITMNCLGGFYGNHIHAYPCLGFHELNNQGLIGGCECDIASAATMVAFTTMTQGRPGVISDPVIDTSKRQIIYAHCVAPNKMFGPEGHANPYLIMNHSEDRQGAALRSILPPGYLTTTLKIDDKRKEIIFHQAIAVGNDPDDRACRTKLCAEPLGDMEKLFTQWDQWGWHRVTFYGDLKKQVYELADSMGWKVVEEA
jgi:L-fucose isomerase-like protein